MIELIYAGMIFSALLGVGIYAFHKNWLQILIYPLMIFLAYVTMLEMPGRGKPVEWEWRELPPLEVISFRFDEDNEALYLWVIEPKSLKPIYYVKKWNQKEAESLTKAHGHKTRMRELGEELNIYLDQSGNFDDEPVFYAKPRPKEKKKTYIEPLDYDAPGS